MTTGTEDLLTEGTIEERMSKIEVLLLASRDEACRGKPEAFTAFTTAATPFLLELQRQCLVAYDADEDPKEVFMHATAALAGVLLSMASSVARGGGAAELENVAKDLLLNFRNIYILSATAAITSADKPYRGLN